jgi:heptose I phosphotransferase
MNRSFQVNPSFSPILTQHDLDSLEKVMRFAGNVVMREVPGRITVKVALPGGYVFYLKRHTRPNPQAASAGPREWDNIATLSRLGISCPTPVAAGSGVLDGAPCSFLITAAIPDSIPLDDYLRQLYHGHGDFTDWRTKRLLIPKLAELAGTLHRRGIHHKDFYLCHVFVNRKTPLAAPLTLIDLQRLDRIRFFRRRWVVKDLAALNYSATTAFTTATDRLRFLMAYLRISRLTPTARRLIRSINRKTDRIRRHDRKLQGLCRTS